MGNSASSQGSSTGTHEGDVGSSIPEEQHDWPIEQAADTPDVQSLQEMRKPYKNIPQKFRFDQIWNDRALSFFWRALSQQEEEERQDE